MAIVIGCFRFGSYPLAVKDETARGERDRSEVGGQMSEGRSPGRPFDRLRGTI
jgi:hypothetical protein